MAIGSRPATLANIDAGRFSHGDGPEEESDQNLRGQVHCSSADRELVERENPLIAESRCNRGAAALSGRADCAEF